MGVFAKEGNQLSYIFSSESHLGGQVLGYVNGLNMDISVIDIAKDELGDTAWTEIAQILGLDFGDILSPVHPDAPDGFENGSFDTTDWLKILGKNPGLLQNAIAINGGRAKLIASRSDILEFYGVDSAGLEQSPQSGPPDTSSNTEEEKFVPGNEG